MPDSRLKIECVDIENVLTSEELKLFPIEKFKFGGVLYNKENVSVIIIKKGKAKVVFYEHGREFILYYLAKNNIYVLEESCMLEFTEESEVYVIDVKTFPEKVQNIHFCNIILGSIVKEIMIERKIINNLVFECCQQRLATFILDLYNKNHSLHINLNLSMQELSNFIGSKRQTVSTTFNDFIREDIIRRIDHHEYLILDLDKLNKILEYK